MNLVRTDERQRSEPWPGARVDFLATADVPSVRVARIGTGEPLLLINGLGANLEMWQPLVRELAPGRELIGFDLPGAGRSARPCSCCWRNHATAPVCASRRRNRSHRTAARKNPN